MSTLKVDAEKFINLLLSKYKAKEIDRKKFATLLIGCESHADESNSALFVNGVVNEITNVKYFLINNIEVINENCKCIFSEDDGIEQYKLYAIYPYILVAFSIDQDNLIEKGYIMSSFRHNIFDEMSKL